MKNSLGLFFLLAAFLQTEAQVTLYNDCYFRGNSMSFKEGRYNLNNTSIGAYKASSVKVAQGWKAILYSGTEPGTSSKIRLTSDMSCLASDWNDKAGSLIVERDGGSGGSSGGFGGSGSSYDQSQVIIFENSGFSGRSYTLQPGRYSIDQMGISNDALSSIRIPSGYRVTIFEDDNFSGGMQNYYANVYTLNSSWNDKASSIIVYGPGGNAGSNNNYQPSYNNNYSRDGVTVYADCNYQGKSSYLRSGRYSNYAMGIGNDAISCFRIPRGYKLTVFEDNNFNGESRTFTSDLYCLAVDWNDKISSMIVQAPGEYGSYPSYNNNSANGVTIYTDCNYRGKERQLTPGNYDQYQMGVGNDAISSFRIPRGYQLTVFEDNNFGGSRRTFTSDLNCLAVDWNDKITSVIVVGP
jgi:hypothetical protein